MCFPSFDSGSSFSLGTSSFVRLIVFWEHPGILKINRTPSASEAEQGIICCSRPFTLTYIGGLVYLLGDHYRAVNCL